MIKELSAGTSAEQCTKDDNLHVSPRLHKTQCYMPLILDACCGGRQFWFDKENPDVLFADRRVMEPKIVGSGKDARVRKCLPDKIMDFRNMDIEDETFRLVVFDPPHLFLGENSFMAQSYGSLNKETWKEDISKGFSECFRVLKTEGILIFKWNECDVPLKEVLKLTDRKPLFGHPSGKAQKTHWVCFMKRLPNGVQRSGLCAVSGNRIPSAENMYKSQIEKLKIDIMNKSNINELSAETEADSNSTAQNQQVSQPNANTNVVGSLFKSREPKYKAWFSYINKMTYSHTIDEFLKIAPFGCKPVWLEYTGLKDINGKEIYEGDIVEAFGYYDLIEFRNASFGCFNKEQNEWITDSSAWTVVGNIFENPELLETLR